MNEHPRILTRPHYIREAGGPLGGGADFVWTPPARTHVELLSVNIVLTTAAGGVSREMFMFVGPVGANDAAIMCPVPHAASLTKTYWWGRGIGSHWTNVNFSYWLGQLPKGLLFAHPEQLRTEIGHFTGTDQIQHWAIRYRLWQDPVVI